MSDNYVTLTPTFIVYLNGTRLGVEHEASVRQIIVKDQIDAPSTCRLVLSDMDLEWMDSTDFDLAQTVSVHLGYKDEVAEVFNGEITGCEVVLKKLGDATTIINCSNKMHRLLKVKTHRVYTSVTDEDIITTIATEYGFTTDLDTLTTSHDVRVQEGITDYEFIRKIADDYNYRFWISEDVLYLKEDTGTGADIVLEWGKSLLEFSGIRDTEKLITEVEVVGWDNTTGDGFSGTSDMSSVTQTVGTGSTGQTLAQESFGDRKVVIKDENVADQTSAETLALSYVTANSWAYLRAKAVCEGDNTILAGEEVDIKETGERFSGTFRVKSVVHNFHATKGYHTICDLDRNAEA